MTRPSTLSASSPLSVTLPALVPALFSGLFSALLSALLCLPAQAADPEGMPDLSDPEQLLDAYIRTVGDTSGNEVLVYASAVVIGSSFHQSG